MGQPKTDRTRGVVFAQKACVNSVSSPRSPIWRVIQSLDAAGTDRETPRRPPVTFISEGDGGVYTV